MIRPLVRALEAALAATCAALGVEAGRREGQPGCWCDPSGPDPRKIGALGLRVERGVSYHGIALNVTVDLEDFELIDPCGMPDVRSTSIAAELGDPDARPTTESVEVAAATIRAGAGDGTRRRAGRDLSAVAAGLFELRKDPITGWWVATVVDRAFHRDRFARAAELVDDHLFGCANCSTPEGDGTRVRMLKDFAFHVVGTDDDARELDLGLAQVALAQARATGSWRTIVAPPGEHRALHAVGNELIEALVGSAREALAAARTEGQTDYLQVVQNWGAQAGARTNHLCLDLYDLPQIPHRIAEELGGAARFVIREGECPWCRLVRDETRRPDRLVWEDDASVAFAPYASRSPFEVWIVPRRHESDFGRGIGDGCVGHGRGPSPGAGPAVGQPRRPPVQPRPAHGAAPRAGRRDVPLALGDPPAAARDRRSRGRDRAAGQPGLPGGRGRGAAGPGRARRGGFGLRRDLRGAAARHTGVEPAVFGPSSARRPMTALPDPSRSENLWSSNPPSQPFAARSATSRPAREPTR